MVVAESTCAIITVLAARGADGGGGREGGMVDAIDESCELVNHEPD